MGEEAVLLDSIHDYYSNPHVSVFSESDALHAADRLGVLASRGEVSFEGFVYHALFEEAFLSSSASYDSFLHVANLFKGRFLRSLPTSLDLDAVTAYECVRARTRYTDQSDKWLDGLARVVAADRCLLFSAFKNPPSRWYNQSYTLAGVRKKGAQFYSSSSALLGDLPKWQSVAREMGEVFDVYSDALRDVAESSFFSSNSAQQILNRQDVLLAR